MKHPKKQSFLDLFEENCVSGHCRVQLSIDFTGTGMVVVGNSLIPKIMAKLAAIIIRQKSTEAIDYFPEIKTVDSDYEDEPEENSDQPE